MSSVLVIVLLLILQTVGLTGNLQLNSKNLQRPGCVFQDSVETLRVPIDTDRSVIFWKGTKMGGKHEGTVKLWEGFLLCREGVITGGRFIVDMNTIAITDIPRHEPVPRKRLRNHLKSEDFFYVEKYPTAAFEIIRTQVLKDNRLRIWGDLSIRDVTQTISFTASQNKDGKSRLEFNSNFTINRFDWNIAYQGSYWERITSILDNNLVHDEIQLSVKLVTDSPLY